jgi:hypothetical protein
MKLDNFGNIVKKREAKALKNYPSHEHEMWDKICEIKSQADNNNVHFLNDIDNHMKEKNPYMSSIDNHSLISDMDHHKEGCHDDISIGSNRKFSELLNQNNEKLLQNPLSSPFLQSSNSNFETMNNKDISDLKSISSFNSDNKFSGKKRQKLIS